MPGRCIRRRWALTPSGIVFLPWHCLTWAVVVGLCEVAVLEQCQTRFLRSMPGEEAAWHHRHPPWLAAVVMVRLQAHQLREQKPAGEGQKTCEIPTCQLESTTLQCRVDVC